MADGRVRLGIAEARDLAEGALLGIGYAHDDARIVADHVIDAALCGYEYSARQNPQHPREPEFQAAAPTHDGAPGDRCLARLRRRE